MPILSRRFLFSIIVLSFVPANLWAKSGAKTVTVTSLDGLPITADIYQAHEATDSPWILLCHQAGWSRGEYQEIAPKLNDRGFNCIAIDQRSGGSVNGVENQTAIQAKTQGKPTAFVDAEQDIVAVLKMLRSQHPQSKIMLWGSSYSSSLALRIAGEQAQLVDAVLAFAPGEYFQRSGKPSNWIATSAAKIQAPAFITSAQKEYSGWKSIFEAIPGNQKVKFIPQSSGNHGSRALWDQFKDSEAYWSAVDGFLENLSR